MTKISIARRRLEVQNREHSYPSGTGTHRTNLISLVSSSSIAEGNKSASASNGLVFPIPEKDAQTLESLATENEEGRRELSATVQREGTVLVMRIQPPSTSRKLISSEVVSEMLGMSRAYVYHLAHEGKLPTYRIGRSLRFDPLDVFDFMSKCLARPGKKPCT